MAETIVQSCQIQNGISSSTTESFIVRFVSARWMCGAAYSATKLVSVEIVIQTVDCATIFLDPKAVEVTEVVLKD